jgi:hypothetical protein
MHLFMQNQSKSTKTKADLVEKATEKGRIQNLNPLKFAYLFNK